MKKFTIVLLLISFLLSACGTETGTTASAAAPAADAVACEIIRACGRQPDELEYVSSAYEDGMLDTYIERLYGLTPDAWDDCAVYRASGANAFEISVFRLTGTMSGTEVTEALETYRHGRQGDFFGYAPEQASIVENSLIVMSRGGSYAAILICEDAGNARETFYAALDQDAPTVVTAIPEPSATPAATAEPSPVPDNAQGSDSVECGKPANAGYFKAPNNDDMRLYDTTDILAAWESGSDEGLNKKERALLARCRELIDEYVTSDMSDYEKESIMYSWLTQNVSYDWSHYDPDTKTLRASYTPYGAIVNGTAVCLGYATAFQLFMDILDIECITVVGAAFDSTEDHAWNMVRIDGEWYCVDATWDNSGTWNYFNVTSEWMAATDHQWDYGNVPLATADDGGIK